MSRLKRMRLTWLKEDYELVAKKYTYPGGNIKIDLYTVDFPYEPFAELTKNASCGNQFENAVDINTCPFAKTLMYKYGLGSQIGETVIDNEIYPMYRFNDWALKMYKPEGDYPKPYPKQGNDEEE